MDDSTGNKIEWHQLKHRFDLRATRPISQRFEKSPRITEKFSVCRHIHIRYAAQDAATLPLIRESSHRAYMHVRDWFDCQEDMVFELWMAPRAVDLQYMTCLPCDDGLFYAPGCRNGMNIILFVSPQSCHKNADGDHLTACFAHEICHHVVRVISHASDFTMKRKENRDVPMWLEEGLCQLIQTEVCSSFRDSLAADIARTSRWYAIGDLWNDLSAHDDVKTAYLQAYQQTRLLMESKGKTAVIQLLYENRTHDANWDDLFQFD